MAPYFRHRLLAALLGAALGGTALSAHAEVDAMVQKAQTLLGQNQALEAFTLLEPSEPQRAGDPDFDLVIGVAANGAGQYMRAIFALERVLSVQPNNVRARAELGRALFAVGDTVGARKQLHESKLQGASGQLVIAVDNLLQSIDRAEAVHQSSVRGYVEASLGHDTNANSGPANANVAVPSFGGLVFVLDPSGVKTTSGFGNVGAGILGRYVLDPRWSLTANAHAQVRKYPGSASQFDTDRVNALAGVTYREERNELTLALNLDVSRLNQALARRQAGLVGEWTQRLDQYRQLSTYFQAFALRHPDEQSARDATRLLLGANYAHTFRNDFTVFGGAYGGTERVQRDDVPHLGHRFVGLRLGAQKPIAETVIAFGAVGYEHRRYGAAEPSFLVNREDHQINLGVGIHWVPEEFWRVTPQLQLTRTQSNIVVNDFDKRVISVTARREF